MIVREKRYACVRGDVDPTPHALYGAASALALAANAVPLPGVLSALAIPASMYAQDYEKSGAYTSRVGQNMRVPCLRRGPEMTRKTQATLNRVCLVMSLATFVPVLWPLGALALPVSLFAGGADIVDEQE